MRMYITLYTAPSRSTKQSIHHHHLQRRQKYIVEHTDKLSERNVSLGYKKRAVDAQMLARDIRHSQNEN